MTLDYQNMAREADTINKKNKTKRNKTKKKKLITRTKLTKNIYIVNKRMHV